MIPRSISTIRHAKLNTQPLTRVRVCSLLVVCLSLGACNGSTPTKKSPPPKPQLLAYPAPPEEARFYFEMTLMNSVQLRRSTSKSRWKEVLTGVAEGGEGLGKPFDVAACQGRVYVTDTVQRQVAAFDFPANRYFRVGTEDPGQLVKPLGINTDGACNIYVADGNLKQVLVYDKDGAFLTAVGGADWFHRLSHVAATRDGSKIFAVDTGGVQTQEHRIRVFDTASGKHLYDIASRGKEDGQLNLPRDIEVGPDGKLYVVDGGNFRVQVFEQDGTFARHFGSVGTRYGQFSRPKGIAADPQGNIYVSDAAFGNFQIFNIEGQLLLFVGERSNTFGGGKYLLPAGIDVDEDGRVYMVDQFYRKVDIFRPATIAETDGSLRREPPVPAASAQ